MTSALTVLRIIRPLFIYEKRDFFCPSRGILLAPITESRFAWFSRISPAYAGRGAIADAQFQRNPGPLVSSITRDIFFIKTSGFHLLDDCGNTRFVLATSGNRLTGDMAANT